jgi:hypothetical protein
MVSPNLMTPQAGRPKMHHGVEVNNFVTKVYERVAMTRDVQSRVTSFMKDPLDITIVYLPIY